MAIVQNPIIGRSSGAFANAVFCKLLGKNILKSKALEVKYSNSLTQQKNRIKLSALSKGAKKFAAPISQGYGKVAISMYPRNYYIKENYENLSVNDSLVLTINYAALQFSTGALGDAASNLTATQDGGDLDLTWTTIGTDFPATVRVYVVRFNATTGEMAINENLCKYMEEAFTWTGEAGTAGDHIYLFAYDNVTGDCNATAHTTVTT